MICFGLYLLILFNHTEINLLYIPNYSTWINYKSNVRIPNGVRIYNKILSIDRTYFDSSLTRSDSDASIVIKSNEFLVNGKLIYSHKKND